MTDVGVGLIGTGFMGKCHALAWNAVKATFGEVLRPRLELLCDLDLAVAERRASEFGFARATADWRAVVADPAVDVVSIAAPNSAHCAMAVAAIEAGKHVWCEKPMAPTLDQARAMAAAAAGRPQVRTLLGYNYIQNPAVRFASRLIRDGAIGRVLQFRGAVDEDYMADPALPWSWRCRLADAGLGTLGDLDCHLVSIAMTLVGDITRLCADMETVHRARPLPGRPGETGVVENEDVAQALIRFEGGASGVIASSRVAWGRKGRLDWEVYGETGTIAADQERMNELRVYLAEGPPELRGFRTILTGPQHPPYALFCPAPGHGLGFNDLKVIEAAHFLRVVAGEEQPAIDFAKGLRIERIIHSIAQSARDRSWIEL